MTRFDVVVSSSKIKNALIIVKINLAHTLSAGVTIHDVDKTLDGYELPRYRLNKQRSQQRQFNDVVFTHNCSFPDLLLYKDEYAIRGAADFIDLAIHREASDLATNPVLCEDNGHIGHQVFSTAHIGLFENPADEAYKTVGDVDYANEDGRHFEQMIFDVAKDFTDRCQFCASFQWR